MSNLSDLLPAGAAAKQLTFTDSGSGISSKAPVVLNSDGTVSAISSTAESIGSTSNPLANESTYVDFGPMSRDIIYDPTADRVIAAINARISGSDNRVLIVAGEVGASSITWGTPLALSGTGVGNAERNCNLCYDEDNGFPLLLFQSYDSSYLYYPTLVAIVVSGSTISLGTPLVLQSAASTDTGGALVYDTTNDKVVALYGIQGVGNNYQWGAVITVSSTTSLSVTGGPTQNNPQAINSMNTAMAFDSSSGLCAIVNQLGTADHFFAQTIDASTGSPVFNTITTIYTNASGGGHVDVCYDSNNQACIATSYTTADWSNFQNVVVPFTTSGSGASASVSAGTPAFTGTSASINYYACCTFDSTNNLTVIPFEYTSGDLYYVTCTLSGSSPYTANLTDPSLLATYSAGQTIQPFCCYDPDQNKTVVIYGTNDQIGASVAFAPASTNLTAQAFVGVADSAISASAAGSVIVQGGTVSGITDPFGTVTATYGSPTAASAYQSESKVLAYDSANNRFVMAYKDGSNSDYGTAVVGELSGTSITWGTPVVFESATTGSNGLDIAFDSNVNRIVIAYQDQGNSSYGTAIVGSVSGSGSGSTIAFGSPTVFESADTRYLGMTFDSNDNRIVIVYSDAGNSYYATYVIGTVTTGPDAISFNTPALLNGSSATYEIDASFDATENKVLVAYTDGSYDLYVLNLAISSGSGTPGTASSFGIGSPQQRFPRCVYDSVNGKSGVAYAEGTNLPIYFSVISMSGSNVTIETRVLAGDTSDSNYFMHNIAFDASSGQLAICTRDASASKGIAYYGSISGTTSSWTTSGSLFADETILPYGVDVAYDTSANKLAFVYSPLSGSNSEAVVGTLAADTFTTGTKYYVTTTGGFSSSADTPSVNAGLAISTTSLLLNGDS